MNHHHLKSRAYALALTTGLALVLLGCAAPNPQPFQQYSAAVKTAGDGLDTVMLQDITWSRDKYIQSVLDGSVSLTHTAILDWKGSYTVVFPSTGNITNQPTFYKLQDVRVTLLSLNSAIEQYVNLLAKLAGSDLVNPDAFAAMAKDTDASLNSIGKQLNAQVPGTAVHIFSVGSAEIMRMVIENHRHKALVKILTESQPAVDSYCSKCVSLLAILDKSLGNDYNAKAFSLAESFSKISSDKRAGDPNARAIVEQLLQLNSDYLALVQSLKSAKGVYEHLPQGHQELLKSIQNQPTDMQAIKAIYEEGKRLKSIYNELPATTSAKKG